MNKEDDIQFYHRSGIAMKILVLHGSPRTSQSQTRRLAGFVMQGAASEGADTEIVDVADLKIMPCTGCESCTLTGTCVYQDDVSGILTRMTHADGIVLGSPVYVDNVTGQLKILVDRLADAIHYQVLTGKYGCAVATTHTSGGDEVVAYLNHVLNYLGVISVGGISVVTRGDLSSIDAAAPDARALGRKLAVAIRNGYSDTTQEAALAQNRAYFKTIVQENRDTRTVDYNRWAEKGWFR